MEMGNANKIALSSSKTYRTSDDDLSGTILDARGHRLTIEVDSDGVWKNFSIVGRPKANGHLIKVQPGRKDFTFDHFYIGPSASGGSHDNEGRDHTAAFVHPYHKGDITFRNGFVTDWFQSYYCSNSGNSPGNEPQRLPGAGGDVHFENCYTERFAHTAYRIGSPGSTIEGCVAANPVRGTHGADTTQRSVWVYQTGGQIRESDFETDIFLGSLYDRDPNPTIENCRGTGSNRIQGGQGDRYRGNGMSGGADLSIPDGVPRSPTQAVVGTEESVGERHYIVDTTRTQGSVTYEVDCSASADTMRPGEYADSAETFDGRIVTGQAGRGIDDWYGVSAELPHINNAVVSGHSDDLDKTRITVDSEPFDFERKPTDMSDNTDESDRDQGQDQGRATHTLVVDGSQADRHQYRIVLVPGGKLTKSDAEGATINKGDTIADDGAEAKGGVKRGSDAYEFTGVVNEAHVRGPAPTDVEIRVDGDPIEFEAHVDDFGGGNDSNTDDGSDSDDNNDSDEKATDTPTNGSDGSGGGSDGDGDETPEEAHTLVFGTATGEEATYDLSVTGTLSGHETKTDTIEGKQVVGSASGNDTDEFEFSGEIEAFGYDGPLTVSLDSTDVSPDSLIPGGDETDETGNEGDTEGPDQDDAQRLYVYGNEWVEKSKRGEPESQVPYTIAVDGDIELDDKADEFEEIDSFGGLKVVSGWVPDNGDDAFRLYGEDKWVHAPRHRLNWEKDREPYEPEYRTIDPREESPGDSDLPIREPPDPEEPPLGPDDGPKGPDDDLNRKYDHYVEVNDHANSGTKVRYHLVTSGEIVMASTGDSVDNRSWLGHHAHGVVSGGSDGYYYDGALLSIFTDPSLGEYRIAKRDPSLTVGQMPFGVFVDGVRENHEEYNPLNTNSDGGADSTEDLPMGYNPNGLSGPIGSTLQPSPDDAQWVFDSWRGFADLNDSDLRPGHVVLFDGRDAGNETIDFPQIAGTLRRFNTDCVTISCMPGTRLASREMAPDRWANNGIVLGGKHSAFVNMSYHGGERDPQPYSGVASVGLELAGQYPVAINNRVSYFGQVGLQCTGIGETVLGVQAHRCHTKGSGYGVSSSGPVGNKNWDKGEVWSSEDLNRVRPWHERTQIKFFDISHCRHHIERGTNTACESGWGMLSKTNEWAGSHDDSHRPARGEENRHDYVIEHDPKHPGHGAWVRGRPRVFRMSNVWFKGWSQKKHGSEVKIKNRYPNREYPFVQVCATEDSYNRRNSFPRDSGPFLSGLGKNPDENDPLVWQVGRTKIGGSEPGWLYNEVSELVSRRT